MYTAISTPSSLLSEEKQKELKTLSSQTIDCEGKALWSQIKGDSQEVSNTLLGKKKKKTECLKRTIQTR